MCFGRGESDWCETWALEVWRVSQIWILKRCEYWTSKVGNVFRTGIIESMWNTEHWRCEVCLGQVFMIHILHSILESVTCVLEKDNRIDMKHWILGVWSVCRITIYGSMWNAGHWKWGCVSKKDRRETLNTGEMWSVPRIRIYGAMWNARFWNWKCVSKKDRRENWILKVWNVSQTRLNRSMRNTEQWKCEVCLGQGFLGSMWRLNTLRVKFVLDKDNHNDVKHCTLGCEVYIGQG